MKTKDTLTGWGGWALIVLALALLMTGCAKNPAPPEQKPIFKLTGIPGEEIKISGVASIEVYAPQQGQQNEPEHWGVTVAKAALNAAVTVGSIYYGGQALTNLADVIGKNAGHNLTTTITNSFNPRTTNTTASYGASP